MNPIDTPRKPVSKTVGGITFDDPYDWLMPDSEEALLWQKRQVDRAVEAVSSLPGFAAVRSAVRRAIDTTTLLGPRTNIASRWFWLGRNETGTAQALRVSEHRDDAGRVLIDAASLSQQRGDDRVTTLAYAQPSPDGRLVALGILAGGGGWGEFRVVEVESGTMLDVLVPALIGNGLRPEWLPDGSGFLLAARGEDGRHHLQFVPVAEGTGPRPTAVFELDEVANTQFGVVAQVSPSGTHAVAVTVPHELTAGMIGDLATDRWRRFVPAGYMGELHGDWLDDDTYVAIATDEPRGRVVAVPVATSTDPTTWRELIPASDAVLRSLQVVDGRLVVSSMRDVSLAITVYETDGTTVGEAPLPPAAAAMGLVGPGRFRPRSDAFTFTTSTFTSTGTTYDLDVATAELTELEAGESLDGLVVEQLFATSADGTRIPYFVVSRADVDRSEPRPTLVSAYGGFNVPLIPSFLGEITPFVQAGGLYVRANLRGGAEYGREWYDSGRLQHKQNVFDDLRAVATDLISRGFATADTLAFQGASNGGLLAGVAVTQQPDLWRVVVPIVPVFDLMEPVRPGPMAELLRSMKLEDYGDPDNPDDAVVLYAYSPYHNVTDKVSYPAVFQVFGEKDPSCAPFHGRRFTAALQHASASELPVLLRVWDDVGHGPGDPETSSQFHAEWLTFVMAQLRMDPAAGDVR